MDTTSQGEPAEPRDDQSVSVFDVLNGVADWEQFEQARAMARTCSMPTGAA